MFRQAVLSRVALWAAVALGLTTMWARYGAATATTLLTILSGAAAVTQSLAAWRLPRRSDASSPEQLDRAADALAWEVRTQWEAEASRRLFADADSLPVRWQARGDNGDTDTGEQDARGAEPLVLTSRSREFEAANAAGIARNAYVVKLLPVQGKTAANYLRDAASDGGLDRWEPILTPLAAETDAAVVEALQTPLMLFLARASDPGR